MGMLRLANVEETKRYTHDNGEDYLDLRAEITKKEATALLKFAPTEEGNLESGLRFISRAFGSLIVAWSVTDAKGKPVEPTKDAYDLLDAAGASWLDRTVGTHLRSVLGVESEEVEGKPDESEAMPSEDTA
jgi:hypothetical protein